MDGQKSQAKLTRTQSSLLRSSPTIRSSIHSLSSINEDEMIASQEEEKKPHRSGSTPRTGSHRFASVLAMASLTFCAKGKENVREGVEFYSNGDFYEGSFTKEGCNGSGVYNYIVNGRYEGDWIDGGSTQGIRMPGVGKWAESWYWGSDLFGWKLLCWRVQVWRQARPWVLPF
ncbi:hypothetical protein CK203_012562 [Vitis vinifera]|uniref:Uncharacterized protein n=1 Tax=Vitis vinifera TaxID=29760 RepID=A0A438KMP8_VITVI|nr:hypothetical protein CK203_012562 [Vitis vinifera]